MDISESLFIQKRGLSYELSALNQKIKQTLDCIAEQHQEPIQHILTLIQQCSSLFEHYRPLQLCLQQLVQTVYQSAP